MYNLNKIEHTNFLRRGILGHRLRRIFNSEEESKIKTVHSIDTFKREVG